jgi:hypothetical protein
MDTVHGYHDGERVRDTRDGTRGTVRFLDLEPAERASGDYAVRASWTWLCCTLRASPATRPGYGPSVQA